MKKKGLIGLLTFALIISALSVAIAANYEIRLKSRQFTPEQTQALSSAVAQFAGRHALVQLQETPNAVRRAALAKRGIHLLKSISGTTWIAAIDKQTNLDVEAAKQIRWLGDLRAEDKIELNVRLGNYLPHSRIDDSRRVFDIGMHRDISQENGREILTEAGAEIHDYSTLTNSFIVALPTTLATKLAQRDEIAWIGEAGLPMQILNNYAREVVGADEAHEPPYSVTGAGVTAFVLDGGSVATGDKSHPDLVGRVTDSGLSMPDFIGHPTHVSCTIAGDGTASDGTYAGMAPEAHIVSTTILPVPTFPPLYNQPGNMEVAYRDAIQNFGASVANNSIGSNLAQFGTRYCDMEGDYERTAQLIDTILSEPFGRITIVWANGNERGNNDGACGNAFNTTAPPATAKNSLAVGAINKDDLAMTPFSSWGPTDDGRLRPDISAPGCATYGGIISCNTPLYGADYTTMCGTSMASPVVTGSVALAQQYWREHMRAEDAWASTMKGLFIHGSVPVGADGPDFSFGYGIANVPNVLDLIDGAIIIEDTLDQGETFTLSLQPNGDPIKVTLVWTDVPGEMLAERVLVNDLDLSVDSDGTIVLPWVLDPANPANAAVKGANHRDPVEQVELAAATGDLVDVVVTGTDVPEGPQRFSLIISGLIDPGSTDDDAVDDDQTDDDQTDDDGTDDDATGDDDDDDDDNDDDDDACGC